MAVPYTFGTATASIPLSQLDSNFSTAITLGNTAIQLGNTVTTLNNMTLANVTISSGSFTITNLSATTANVTTANVVTLIVTGNETVQGNTSVTGTATAAKFIPTGNSATGNGMYLPATNAVGISTNGTNAVYIDASQNVGIGQSSPTVKLDVNGATNFGGTSGVRCGIGTAFVGGQAEVYSQGAVPLGIGTASTQVLRFYTNSTLASTLDTSGNLLVGCTALPAGARTKGFGAKSNSTGGIQIYQAVSNTDWAINATSGSIANFYSDNGTALVFAGYIAVNGNITSYLSISDYRLKENVQPMVGALAKVQALKPVTFNFKDGGQSSQGFIAHELQEVVPDCVSGTKDAVDADGKPQYQGVDTSFLVATLTAAIQEQQALITSLTARIEALEAK
jgi:hypothetical protein